MQLYFIADKEGHLADNRVLHEGKTKEVVGSPRDPLAKYHGPVNTSPLVAALTHPDDVDGDHCKMFEVQRWKVSVDQTNPEAYTVVKEVPVPTVTIGQKVAFAVATMHEIYHDTDFQKWAKGWLSGTDRSLETAKVCREATEKEIEAAKEVEALAAWGAAGGDDQEEQLKQQEDLEQRAIHTLRAAEMLVTEGAEAKDIMNAIKAAMNRVNSFGNSVNLASIAEQVLKIG